MTRADHARRDKERAARMRSPSDVWGMITSTFGWYFDGKTLVLARVR